jgi:hypothetical protein
MRLVANTLENLLALQQIQRIRGYYRGLVPEAEQFFAATGAGEGLAAAVASTGVRATRVEILFTAASMIAAINSILGGAGLALLAGRLGRLGSGLAVLIGVAGTLVLFGLHLWYGFRRGAQFGMRPEPMRGRPRR